MHKNIDTVEEFWSWEQIEESLMHADASSRSEFLNGFTEYVGVPTNSAYPVPSGHQGLELLLRANVDPRRVVMVPAFNCKVVQNAIESAGYRSKVYDFSPRVGEFDWDRVVDAISPAVGVVIVTHYFGVPTDLRELKDYCHANDILLVEDCAQTLGGLIAGAQVGTFGDVAIFSFNYDKPISLAWGGMVVINKADRFNRSVIESGPFHIPERDIEFKLLGEFAAAMAVRRRSICYQYSRTIRLLKRAQFIKAGVFRRNPRISIGAVQAELGRWCMGRYSDVEKVRNRNAEFFAANVTRPTWPVSKDVQPAWVKQKVQLDDSRTLRRISVTLQRNGIRAGNFNWPGVIEGEGQESCKLAAQGASCWMDVPIHQGMSHGDLEQVIASIEALS